MNDPWTPQFPTNVIIQPAPVDPLHQLISADKYLDSLEKKLGRIKGPTAHEPTSRDIVNSLSKFRDDQMEHFLKGETTQSNNITATCGDVTSSSYLQRRLYPEKQPVTGEELVVLVQDDALAKRVAEEQEEEESIETVSMATDKEARQPIDSGDSVTKATVAMETETPTLQTGEEPLSTCVEVTDKS